MDRMTRENLSHAQGDGRRDFLNMPKNVYPTTCQLLSGGKIIPSLNSCFAKSLFDRVL